MYKSRLLTPVCMGIVFLIAASQANEASGAVVKTIKDKNGTVVGVLQVTGRVLEFIDIQPDGKLNVTTFFGPSGNRQQVDIPNIDPDADSLSKIGITLSNGQAITFERWAGHDGHLIGTVQDVDNVCTDLTTTPTTCEEWDGAPLEAGWSITDLDNITNQIGDQLVVTGTGVDSNTEITPMSDLKCFILQDIAATVSPEDPSPIRLDFFYLPVGGGPEFIGLTEEFRSVDVIPATSNLGLIVLALLISTAGLIVVRRGRQGYVAV